MTRIYKNVNDQSNENYDAGDEIIYNAEVLKSSLSYFNDAYILVKGNITVIKFHSIQVSFKNCEPCTKYIIKLDITTIDDAEYLDLLLPMHNLMEHKIVKKKQEVYGVIQKRSN